jgi:membrane protease YdiL (CAAX protease family)
MTNRSIFFGDDGVLRSGWRFAVFALLFVAGGTLFGTLVVALLYAVSQGQPATSTFLVVNGLASLAVALTAGWACGRYLERLPFSALGASFTGPWLRNFLIGLLLGGLTFALGAGIGAVSGGLSFALNPAPTGEILSTFLISFVVFAAAAAFEEALFRGYILQTFIRSELTLFGVVLTSLLFASVHNANPAATWLSWINTFIAGVWFAIAYLKTRDLWLAFGLHLAWNWTQGSVFGVEVSGLTDIVRAPLMRESDAGPAWLTGGDYGIEGGVITTAAILISTVALYFLPFGAPPDGKEPLRSSGS